MAWTGMPMIEPVGIMMLTGWYHDDISYGIIFLGSSINCKKVLLRWFNLVAFRLNLD